MNEARKVETEEGQQLADGTVVIILFTGFVFLILSICSLELKIAFMEVSAKTAHHIDNLLRGLLALVLHK